MLTSALRIRTIGLQLRCRSAQTPELELLAERPFMGSGPAQGGGHGGDGAPRYFQGQPSVTDGAGVGISPDEGKFERYCLH